MVTKNCTFCGSPIEPGSGTMYVRKNGAIYNFCSRKCKVNLLELKHVSRNTRWANEFHRLKELRKKSSS